MQKRRLTAEFAIQVFSNGGIEWDGFQDYLWRHIHEGPKRALAARRRKRRPRR